MQEENLKPVVLAILDGWGYSEKIKGNAIQLASTPIMDKLWNNYNHSLLSASGIDVGLPKKQVGNSEVGHATIGSGRIINQDLVRIDRSINDETFFKSPNIHNICKITQINKSKLHLIGLCSDGGVHSHVKHLLALIDTVKRYDIKTCIHVITDGRDTQPKAAKKFIQIIVNKIHDYSKIDICTVSGRYYSMDRDCRWQRTEKYYNILINNQRHSLCDPIALIDHYYEQGISDEFITPTRINKGEILNNDGIIFFNFRPDRIRQLVYALKKPGFKGFTAKIISELNILTFTRYDESLSLPVIFPPQKHKNFLGEVLSNKGLKQFRLAETEKYAHVTYFFNGGVEEPFPGEDRELISSPRVDTYDLTPKMSADKITKSAIKVIENNKYKFIVINYANPDMVGHTGNLEATIEAITMVDGCIGKLYQKVNEVKGTLLITADHGNADYMLDQEDKPCKSHSTNLVPFILVQANKPKLREKGSLADIAPTILDLLHFPIPDDMSGISLKQI